MAEHRETNSPNGSAQAERERERKKRDRERRQSVERVERESEDENAGLRSGGECWLVGMSNYSL